MRIYIFLPVFEAGYFSFFKTCILYSFERLHLLRLLSCSLYPAVMDFKLLITLFALFWAISGGNCSS